MSEMLGNKWIGDQMSECLKLLCLAMAQSVLSVETTARVPKFKHYVSVFETTTSYYECGYTTSMTVFCSVSMCVSY